jgi:hypothetical protein
MLAGRSSNGLPRVSGDSALNDSIDLVRRPSVVPTGRCCPSHPDWPTLTEHLMAAFPMLGLEETVRAVAEAKTTTDGMDLPTSEALGTGEVLARLRLQERAGRAPEITPQSRR